MTYVGANGHSPLLMTYELKKVPDRGLGEMEN
jgi:hypothetical protein